MPPSSPKSYDPQIGSANAGSQYLFIDESLVKQNRCAAHVSSTKQQMKTHDICLESFLLNVIQFQNHAGRRIYDRNNVANDPWSEFIWDVVDAIKNKDALHPNPKPTSNAYPRIGQDSAIFFMRGDGAGFGSDSSHTDGNATNVDMSSEDGEGMGLLLFEREDRLV